MPTETVDSVEQWRSSSRRSAWHHCCCCYLFCASAQTRNPQKNTGTHVRFRERTISIQTRDHYSRLTDWIPIMLPSHRVLPHRRLRARVATAMERLYPFVRRRHAAAPHAHCTEVSTGRQGVPAGAAQADARVQCRILRSAATDRGRAVRDDARTHSYGGASDRYVSSRTKPARFLMQKTWQKTCLKTAQKSAHDKYQYHASSLFEFLQ